MFCRVGVEWLEYRGVVQLLTTTCRLELGPEFRSVESKLEPPVDETSVKMFE